MATAQRREGKNDNDGERKDQTAAAVTIAAALCRHVREIEERNEIEELEVRIQRDKALLRRLERKREEHSKGIQQEINKLEEQALEEAQRKKLSRAQDTILRTMIKVMDDCNAQGFIYGIVSESGKATGGSSDSLREWWKERVRFDRNAPLAVSKYRKTMLAMGEQNEGHAAKPRIQWFLLSSESSTDPMAQEQCSVSDDQGNGGSGRTRKNRKRRLSLPAPKEASSAAQEANADIPQHTYTCENWECPSP
ncbi:hypothetical protein J5N97_022743 [Dioscorea zingiberensis]|uniref:Ethylene insensitive 3-like DNA-binding domain-containing protein n=1 Tax=Dioscorea zingiberensis TaxID=325984 RepID=A0A9D5CB53_9LILI|nr:hypothetical protein J5N97_022743 [Dioscorea zingiberensis]